MFLYFILYLLLTFLCLFLSLWIEFLFIFIIRLEGKVNYFFCMSFILFARLCEVCGVDECVCMYVCVYVGGCGCGCVGMCYETISEFSRLSVVNG